MVAAAVILQKGFDGLIDPARPLGVLGTAMVPIGLGFATALLAGLGALERKAAERFAQHYVAELRLDLFGRLARLSSREVKARSQGPMMLRFVTDISAVRQWLSQGFARLLVAGLGAIGGLAGLAVLDPRMGLVTFGIVAVGAIAAIRLSGPYHASVDRARRRRSRLAANLGDKLGAMNVARAFGQVRRERRRLRRQGDKLAQAMVTQAAFSGGLRALPDLVIGLSTAVVLVIGAREVESGAATPGVVVASLAILGIVARPLRDLGRSLEFWQAYRVGRRRLLAFLAETARPDLGLPIDVLPEGRIAFEQVALGQGREGISGTVEPRTIVAVVGPTGSGKSTLLRLVARLDTPNEGRVTIDGHDIASIAHRTLRRTVALAGGDDLPLVRGSIGSNLAYGRRRASVDDMLAVAKRVGLAAEPGGTEALLDSPVGDSGRNLPSGIRQQIALGRALLCKPAILLLDDPSAHLDASGRAALYAILKTRTATVLMSTGDIDLVRAADDVWFLEAGRLVERGAPGALLASGGATARYFGMSAPADARAFQIVS